MLPDLQIARRGAAFLIPGILLVLALAGCRAREATPGFEELFEHVKTVEAVPIDPFHRMPTSLAVLPDGRLVIPETGGVWLHVIAPDGTGLTRLGGKAPTMGHASGVEPGKFLSISSITATPEGKLLASDRASNVVSVFNAALEPDSTLTVPGARAVLQIDQLPDGRFAAAVSPRDPEAGGQIVLFAAGDSARTLLPREPIIHHNRWQPVSSTRMEVLRDGRILAYWAPLPWAKVLSQTGDSQPRIGKLSARYEPPSSGPGAGSSLEALRRWYESFTPLIGLESVAEVLVFQFLAVEEETDTPRRSARKEAPSRERQRQIFLNVYDEAGRLLASDLFLPPGSRILASNDRSQLYLLTKASPRELEIGIWRPKPPRVQMIDRE